MFWFSTLRIPNKISPVLFIHGLLGFLRFRGNKTWTEVETCCSEPTKKLEVGDIINQKTGFFHLSRNRPKTSL